MKKRKTKYHIHPKLQDQAVWMSVAAVFLLFYIALISFSEHPNLTGSAVQNIAFVKAGTQLDFGVDEIPGLVRYKFEVTETIKNGQMLVKVDETIPFERPYYSKFRISSPEEDKIGTVLLLLKLEEQALFSKGISKGDAQVFRNGEEVETIFTKQEGRYLYYSATAPGLGEFVIGKAAPATEARQAPPLPEAEEAAAEETETAPVEEAAPEEITAFVGEAAAPSEAPRGVWVRIKQFLENFWG